MSQLDLFDNGGVQSVDVDAIDEDLYAQLARLSFGPVSSAEHEVHQTHLAVQDVVTTKQLLVVDQSLEHRRVRIERMMEQLLSEQHAYVDSITQQKVRFKAYHYQLASDVVGGLTLAQAAKKYGVTTMTAHRIVSNTVIRRFMARLVTELFGGYDGFEERIRAACNEALDVVVDTMRTSPDPRVQMLAAKTLLAQRAASQKEVNPFSVVNVNNTQNNTINNTVIPPDFEEQHDTLLAALRESTKNNGLSFKQFVNKNRATATEVVEAEVLRVASEIQSTGTDG